MPTLMNLVLAFRPSSDECWIADITSRFPDSFVRVIQLERKRGENGNYAHVLFEVITSKKNRDKIRRALAGNKLLEELHLVSVKKDKLYGSAKSICSKYCPFANIPYAFLRCVHSSNNGEVYWNFVGSNYECRRIMQELTDFGVFYRVAELSTIKENGGMTGRQELVLRVAYELGYFDYPKRINIRELAAIFNVTPATLTEEIRKALKKALTHYFKESKTPSLENEYNKIINEYTEAWVRS
ncbi:MAG TPA: hypothetical protein EYH45_02980 [Candidatus Caldiarchaeum subterraneum]|uniref:HTH bat-type domain-containing protein n=1 Tax=Caldiarchaeum subterraneum TaxID=311458 RepID=A0A833A3L6_CALS0|nr:hypothetical protein [Aigarchaeota archaeon]HIQ29508.1 hypothetical protein [Candidatus Caldarchaeum subterraneum]